MPINRIALGSHQEVYHPGALKAAFAEFISTLIFVFAGQGSGMAFSESSAVCPLLPMQHRLDRP